ncbi:hypothetical protein [Pedobacter boryungensis]|uniref:Outer membrane protein beta-barrel domain-containing protein n=1 Tax=Pedobacter boryungensis TaxID=869962 RepID=A0ABX2DFX9_9SPHI|nr:hypothetical protein [Pedobacter boryungensis]NQX32998.1 hypothetical protein [Pedobacter boryungensis]
MKNIDEELVSQIKSVFEDVDDGASEQGWLALREKYPEANRKLPIWWMTGIAASILVVLGLFLWVKSPKEIKHTTQNVKTKVKPEVKPITGTKKAAQQTPLNQDKAPNSPIREDQQLLAKEKTTDKTIDDKATTENVKVYTSDNAIVANAKEQANSISKVDSVKEKMQQNPVIANQPILIPTETNDTKKTTEEFLKEQTKLLAKSSTKVEEKSKTIKNSIDVFTGTFVNYYADNAVKLNAGFGVNANVKLTKGVFVSFGAGVSQNKMDYKNSVPVTAVASSDALKFYATKGGSITTSSISDVRVNAQLLNLDLPVTLKFYPTKKQNFYVAAGVNSNSYLTQKYTYGYNVNTVSSFGYTSEPKEEVERTKLKGFDFANSAIFAIGINQNIGKNNSLIFEPYFKPAIGSMGEKNLKINTVGLNLKFTFTPSKK